MMSPSELADELMAMAGSVAASSTEYAACLIREAAFQLRINEELLEELETAAAIIAEELGSDYPDSQAAIRAAIERAKAGAA